MPSKKNEPNLGQEQGKHWTLSKGENSQEEQYLYKKKMKIRCFKFPQFFPRFFPWGFFFFFRTSNSGQRQMS